MTSDHQRFRHTVLDRLVSTLAASLQASLYPAPRRIMDTAFRKIDIDQYDEDRLVPSDLYDPDPRGPDGVLTDARNKSAEVRSLLSR